MGGVRTLVVRCPDWAVVAAGVPLDEPAAVFFANRVVASSPAARDEGVDVGLRRRESQSRCPDLVVLDHDPARDARAFEPVVAALDELTPRIEVEVPGQCAFPTLGPSRYFGGDEALAVARPIVRARRAAATSPSSSVSPTGRSRLHSRPVIHHGRPAGCERVVPVAAPARRARSSRSRRRPAPARIANARRSRGVAGHRCPRSLR